MTDKPKDKIAEKAALLLRGGYICDSCLGRQFAELLSGMTNKERGETIRRYTAFLADSGEQLGADTSNFFGIKLRHLKLDAKPPGKCRICNGLFAEGIINFAGKIAKKTEEFEFDTFLIGTIISSELAKAEERMWEVAGIDFVEPIKNEINREVGKSLESISDKAFDLKDPDITAIIDMENDKVAIQVKSLYIRGKYKKLARGIPQTEWICKECGGKGCIRCEGIGKMYGTSVQGIIEKPLIKAAKAKKSKFHGSGREDIDARCLSGRPFIIELVRPMARSIDLESLERRINRSNKVKVTDLSIATARDVDVVKSARHDKTYFASVTFEKDIDRSKVALIRSLKGVGIRQRTPQRVLHRRANLLRDRGVREIKARLVGKRKLEVTVRGEAGLYIKELIHGDSGRTQPNIADIIGNKVKSIKLDVIKIHC